MQHTPNNGILTTELLLYFRDMNKHQAALQNYEQALRKEFLSHNGAHKSVALLQNWNTRAPNDRLNIYDNVFKGIGHFAATNNSFYSKLQDVLHAVNDPVLHFCVINMSTYQPIEYLSVLTAVDIKLLDKDLKMNAIRALLRTSNDQIRATKNMEILFTNYVLFQPCVRPQKKNIALLSAQTGHADLLKCLNWAPKNPTQKREFFLSCCAGGLLEFITPLEVSDHDTLHKGLVKSLRYGHSHVADYITSLSTVQWNTVETFEALLHAPDPLFDQLAVHYKTHPQFPQLIRQAAYLSMINTKGNLSKILPHAPMEGLESLVRVAVTSRSKTHMKILLAHIGEQNFNKGLENVPSKDLRWAQNYRAQLQQRCLKKEVKAVTPAVRKSKM